MSFPFESIHLDTDFDQKTQQLQDEIDKEVVESLTFSIQLFLFF